jgi:prepilin-type N-terminal cleavage/methylation domain-containing protein
MRNRAKSATGFTLVELMVVIAIVAVLAGVLLDRVWFYQEQAEKAAMEQVAGALQSALVLRYGQMLTRGREAEVSTLVTDNPINWLMKKPPNYVGEFFAPTPGAISPGNWAFDLKNRELVYVPYRTTYFVAGSNGYKWVRFRTHLQYSAPVGSKSKNAQELSGVLFEPAEAYKWLVKGQNE